MSLDRVGRTRSRATALVAGVIPQSFRSCRLHAKHVACLSDCDKIRHRRQFLGGRMLWVLPMIMPNIVEEPR